MSTDSDKVKWHRIQRSSYVNGPGPRTVLWMTGCPVHCPGCQNRNLWEASAKTRRAKPRLLAEVLLKVAGGQPLTITGGEPFFQPEALLVLLVNIRLLDHHADRRREIVVYSGYTWEDLLGLSETFPQIDAALRLIDVLVDGPYRPNEDDDWVQWRGSRNQRVIDVQLSIVAGALDDPIRSLRGDIDGDDGLILLDWDTLTLTLVPGILDEQGDGDGSGHGSGQIVGAAGLMRELFAGTCQDTSRCGAL